MTKALNYKHLKIGDSVDSMICEEFDKAFSPRTRMGRVQKQVKYIAITPKYTQPKLRNKILGNRIVT